MLLVYNNSRGEKNKIQICGLTKLHVAGSKENANLQRCYFKEE